MQAPKRKTSKSVRNQRRAHDALFPRRANSCPKCGAMVLQHHVCLSCGYYRGKQFVDVAAE